MKAYETIKSVKHYSGSFFEVVEDTISMPDGNLAKRAVVVRGNAAAIIPVDKDGNIIFVRQYRHPAKQMVLEIPAGMFDRDEEPLTCAERELTEETGFIAGKMTFVTKMYISIGFTNEMIYLYLAEDLTVGAQDLDEDEFVEVEKYSLDDAIEMIYDGRIVDSKTMVGLLAYKDLKNKKS